LLLVVWDEHGGIFDHVPPPRLPYGDGTPETPFEITAPRFDFRRLGVRVGAIVVSPYVNPGVDHTLFEHAAIPATVTEQFIGPRRDHAPFLREQNANILLDLLAPISPRMDWPRFKGAFPLAPARPLNGPASGFQLEHVREVHAVLARNYPDIARLYDPTAVRTSPQVAAFLGRAMAALDPGSGRA
jgi:Phosphoesterase family